MPTTTDIPNFPAPAARRIPTDPGRYHVLERCSDILVWVVYAGLIAVAAALIGQ